MVFFVIIIIFFISSLWNQPKDALCVYILTWKYYDIMNILLGVSHQNILILINISNQ